MSLFDVLGFLRSNLKLFGVLFLALLVALLAVVLLLPQEYQKRVSLTVEPAPSSLLAQVQVPNSRVTVPSIQAPRVGEIAVNAIEQRNFSAVQVSPRYDRATEQVQVTLQAATSKTLANATPAVVAAVEKGFQAEYEDLLGTALGQRLNELDRTTQVNDAVVAELDKQISQASSDPDAAARQQGLETQRAVSLAESVSAETERRNLERARNDLPRLASEPTRVEVVKESGVGQTGSLGLKVLVAVLAALVLAAVLTVAWAIVRRLFSSRSA